MWAGATKGQGGLAISGCAKDKEVSKGRHQKNRGQFAGAATSKIWDNLIIKHIGGYVNFKSIQLHESKVIF